MDPVEMTVNRHTPRTMPAITTRVMTTTLPSTMEVSVLASLVRPRTERPGSVRTRAGRLGSAGIRNGGASAYADASGRIYCHPPCFQPTG